MLRAVIICPDSEVRSQLLRSLEEITNVGIIRAIDRYPAPLELTRFIRAHAPQLVFLSMESVEGAANVLKTVESTSPGIQAIALGRTCDPQTLMMSMRIGIREFVYSPFERPALMESLSRAYESLQRKPVEVEATDQLYSFLPSKAGVGATTLAVNTAVALSRIENTPTFLADFDLNSGMVRFMLKLDNTNSVVEAAERAGDIDENLWPQLVSSLGPLDILHAGKLNPNLRVESIQVRNLLGFVRRNYKMICADLSGNLEKYSLEIMHESKRVFLVCTPEIPSLHLAREKYDFLKSIDLGDRVTLLLNRCQKRPLIAPEQIEELLGLPVHMTFPNDYQCVHRALAAAKPIESGSELARQCNSLAHSLVEKKSVPVGEPKKRFIEYFSISPSKYAYEGKKTGS